jgi:hypothetical protein
MYTHTKYHVYTPTTDANKDLFTGKVFGPIAIELEVDNDDIGKYVEAAVNYQLDYFVVERKEDFRRWVHAYVYQAF